MLSNNFKLYTTINGITYFLQSSLAYYFHYCVFSFMVLLEAIINNLDEAVFLFDKKYRLVFINKIGEEFLGKNLTELKSIQFKNLFPGAKDVLALVRKTIKEGRSLNCKDMEIDIGRTVNTDLNISPYYLQNSLEGAILCLRENLSITERNDYHFDSLLYLLGSIAHEIRNPLGGIKGAAQILRGSAENPEAVECINLLLKEADRLNSILQSYLTITRRPVFNHLNIHEIIEHAMKVMGPVFKDKNIRIGKSYDPSLPNISGDESKLLQVFINLLKNSVEAMETIKGVKTLNITTRPSGEYMVIYERGIRNKKAVKTKKQRWVVISVQDNGTGIPGDDLNRIFLPFYTKKDKGSGLGLALSKKIVKDHGGIIKAKSRPLKETTFSVYLPF